MTLTQKELPAVPREMVFRHFGSDAGHPLLRTVWKDGIDLETPTYSLQCFAETYARFALGQKIERLQAALKTSATALERAAGDIAAWGAYADEYFQGKHELAADIEAARIAAISTRAALTPQKEQG